MKIVILVLFCSLLLNLLLLAAYYRKDIVVAVPDGDSLALSDGRRIRLLGIDAPEVGRCMAAEAKTALTRLAQGHHVRLKDTLTDGYGRVLSIVIVEDIPTWFTYLSQRIRGVPLDPDPLVNRAMLGMGLARYTYSAPSDYKSTLKSAADRAKAAGVGIYACRSQQTGDCLIKGNLRGGAKTYHLTTCDNYSQVIVDEAYGDQWFCSQSDAEAAGFAKAAGCR